MRIDRNKLPNEEILEETSQMLEIKFGLIARTQADIKEVANKSRNTEQE